LVAEALQAPMRADGAQPVSVPSALQTAAIFLGRKRRDWLDQVPAQDGGE